MNRRQQLARVQAELDRLADAAAVSESADEVDRLAREAERLMAKISELEGSEE